MTFKLFCSAYFIACVMAAACFVNPTLLIAVPVIAIVVCAAHFAKPFIDEYITKPILDYFNYSTVSNTALISIYL